MNKSEFENMRGFFGLSFPIDPKAFERYENYPTNITCKIRVKYSTRIKMWWKQKRQSYGKTKLGSHDQVAR